MDGIPDERQRWGWKRVGRFIGGWTLMVVGVLGCILPIIPGVPLILAGLALLASEYAWAQRWMDAFKGWLARFKKKR